MTGPGVTFWRVRAAQATSRNRAQEFQSFGKTCIWRASGRSCGHGPP